jgi:hypothetical protein
MIRHNGMDYIQFKNSLFISLWSCFGLLPNQLFVLPDTVAAHRAVFSMYWLWLDLDQVTAYALPEFFFWWGAELEVVYELCLILKNGAVEFMSKLRADI